MGKVIVIGAGASGLTAAIWAARKGLEVVLLERNSEPGKKILITGSGKCNYFNEDQNLIHYHTPDQKVLEKIITEENRKEILTFFHDIGLVPQIKNQYYYPFSMQATSMKEALLVEAKNQKVQIQTSFMVEEIQKVGDTFYINPQKENIEGDYVIWAPGSKAAPKTGSDGRGYAPLSSLGHTVREVLPALCPLYGEASYFKLWDGVRAQAKISLYIDGICTRMEEGEIQLTKYGVSGICVFNVSGEASKALFHQKKVKLSIDFMPFLKEDAFSFLTDRNRQLKNRTIEQLLEGFLSYKIIHVILKESHIPREKGWKDLTLKEQKTLVSYLTEFPLPIQNASSFEKAQVCTGGIPLTEIDPFTMESLKVPGLYITGEILDVDGDCGGYNLGFAFITGKIAGDSVGGKNDSY